MASLNDPDVRIQVLINKDTNQGRFNDAMYFTADEYNALSNQQVKDMANARKDAWVRAVKDARDNPRRITKAEKIAAREAQAEQLAALDADIAVTPEDPAVVPKG
jgi:hypothetical protein